MWKEKKGAAEKGRTPVGNYLSHRLGQWAATERLLQLKQPHLQLQVTARAFDARLA